MTPEHVYDLLIIGGGPVGLFSAYYAGMRQADVAIMESLPQLGGQAATLFPEKIVYDVGGIPKIKAKTLVQQQIQQLAKFNPKLLLQTTAKEIQAQADGSYLVTTNQQPIAAKAIIIAIGTGAFAPRRLACPYDPDLEKKDQLNYFVDNLEKYRDQDVVVAGGGDSAIDWALALEPIASSVAIVHRRQQFRGLEASVARLQDSRVKIMTPYLIKGVTRAEQQLQLKLKKVKTTESTTLITDKLLVNYGFTADSRVLRSWGLDLQGNKIPVNSKMETNLKNIYAVGDVITYPGKLDLIALGYGEAPIAVTSALQSLYPEKIQPIHSTALFNS